MEEDRLGRVRLLLETLLSYLPGELRSSIESPSGPAPSLRVPCTACGGAGIVRRGKMAALCPACDGHGWRKRRAGEPHYDEYTKEQIGQEQPLRSATSWELDAAISRLRATEAERGGATNEAAWVRKKRSLYAAGDYMKLELAVERAYEDFPRATKAAWQILVLGYDPLIVADATFVLEGVEVIASHMPSEIRVPGWLLPDRAAHKRSLWHGRSPRHALLRAQRNAEIRALRADGVSPTKIAERYGMTRRMVQYVLSESDTFPPTRSEIAVD